MNYSIISTILKRAAGASLFGLLFMVIIEVPIILTYVAIRYTTIFLFTAVFMALWELVKILYKRSKS